MAIVLLLLGNSALAASCAIEAVYLNTVECQSTGTSDCLKVDRGCSFYVSWSQLTGVSGRG